MADGGKNAKKGASNKRPEYAMGWHLNARGLVPLMVGWDLTFIVFEAHVLGIHIILQ